MFRSGLLRFVSKMKVSNRELPVRASMLQDQLLLIMTMMATLIFMWSLNFTGKDKEIGYLRIKETVFLLMSVNQKGVDNENALGRGASWGDYDNDGDMDLAISNLPPTDKARTFQQASIKIFSKRQVSQIFKTSLGRLSYLGRAMKTTAKIGGIGDTGAGMRGRTMTTMAI